MAISTQPYTGISSILGGTLGNYLAQTSNQYDRYKNLYAPIGKYLGGMASSLLSAKPLDSYLTSTLGNLGQIIGTGVGGQDNRWAGPTGQIAGTALSSLLQGKNPFSTAGSPTSLQNYLGALGSGFGGNTGGLIGTVGGNLLGNALQGYNAGKSAMDILSNIGSFPNIASLAGTAARYLLPKSMDPMDKAAASQMIGQLGSTISSAVGPTAGATIGSTLGTGVSNALGTTFSSIPIALPLAAISWLYGGWQMEKEQKEVRKADEKWTANYNQNVEQNWENYAPLYDRIKAIGQQRLSTLGPGGYYGAGGGLDPTTGLTQEELVMLFGRDYADQTISTTGLLQPAPKARSSYSEHVGQWPFEQGLANLMNSGAMTPQLDFNKIIPWLEAGGSRQQQVAAPGSSDWVRNYIEQVGQSQAAQEAFGRSGGMF